MEDQLTPEIAAMKQAYLTGKKVPDLEIALASFSVLDEYRHRALPTAKPKEITEYFALPPDTRKKMNASPDNYANFWNNPVVKDYWSQIDAVKNKNEVNKQWLQWMKKIFDDVGDAERAHSVGVKLYAYKQDEYEKKDAGFAQPDWSE